MLLLQRYPNHTPFRRIFDGVVHQIAHDQGEHLRNGFDRHAVDGFGQLDRLLALQRQGIQRCDFFPQHRHDVQRLHIESGGILLQPAQGQQLIDQTTRTIDARINVQQDLATLLITACLDGILDVDFQHCQRCAHFMGSGGRKSALRIEGSSQPAEQGVERLNDRQNFPGRIRQQNRIKIILAAFLNAFIQIVERLQPLTQGGRQQQHQNRQRHQ